MSLSPFSRSQHARNVCPQNGSAPSRPSARHVFFARVVAENSLPTVRTRPALFTPSASAPESGEAPSASSRSSGNTACVARVPPGTPTDAPRENRSETSGPAASIPIERAKCPQKKEPAANPFAQPPPKDSTDPSGNSPCPSEPFFPHTQTKSPEIGAFSWTRIIPPNGGERISHPDRLRYIRPGTRWSPVGSSPGTSR